MMRLADIRAPTGTSAAASRSASRPEPRRSGAETGDTAALMIGQDDESWDISVAFPIDLVDEIVRQAAAHALA
jgi:hypothetical protein